MKKYLVTLRLHTTEVNLGIVEASCESHAAELVGAVTNDPDEYASDYTWNLGHKNPGDADGGGTLKFYEMTEIKSVAQFREIVSRQKLLEKRVAEVLG